MCMIQRLYHFSLQTTIVKLLATQYKNILLRIIMPVIVIIYEAKYCTAI